ncbi:hypothetical protein [Arcticibacterium luteifluviistationis]|uniref:Uncharacterized protein n=1 Tax=Arcticibacterium luteifluviistationis TaxID=1784714 RepID=A0A2Z4GA06_9BACT|nr:hypothetical protein [Arcticibacterium luteifluviistationis]AWV97905.1 hypothetical protein DJ013_06880 [Arcticibacterium luteifluviistationis]
MSFLLFQKGRTRADQDGERITAEQFTEMTTNFDKELVAGAFEYRAFTFNKESIEELFDEGVSGLMVAFAKHSDNYITVALLPINEDKNVVVSTTGEGDGVEDGTGHEKASFNSIIEKFVTDVKSIKEENDK